MAEPSVTEIFVKRPDCQTVNRIVAAGLRDCEMVSCSNCQTSVGEVGKLRLMVGSYHAGASRFRTQSPTEH